MTISTTKRNLVLRILDRVVPRLIDRPLSDLDTMQREVYYRFTNLVLEENDKLIPTQKTQPSVREEVYVGTIFDSRQLALPL